MWRAIYEKPLAELTWSDFESVVFNRLEEDQTLEFKETLPARDGSANIWQLGQDKIGGYARDTLAKEVVAFRKCLWRRYNYRDCRERRKASSCE
jgi:hypothetical protein